MYVAYAATASSVSGGLGARLIESLVIMIIGMGAVFLMLTISMFGMMLLGKIAGPQHSKKKNQTVIKELNKVQREVVIGEDEESNIAAALAVIHHIRRKMILNIPLINRKDI